MAGAPCAALLLGLLLAGCWPEAQAVTPVRPPQKNPDLVQVSADQMHQLDVVEVSTRSFGLHKPAIGQIAFNEDASTAVLSPFSGRVTRVLAKMGDKVTKGDPLFEIDSPEVSQAQSDLIAAVLGLEKSQSALTVAQRQAERLNNLLASRAISLREAEQARNEEAAAQSDYKTALGTLTAARNRLRIIIGRDQTEVERVERERVINPLITINTPIDGTIIARKIGPGQYVRTDATDALYSIADLSTMWLKANVPEVDIPLIRVGQSIEVRVNALPNTVLQARITAIGASSDSQTRRVVVRSEIPNPDGALKSEMFASFKITVGEFEPMPAVPIGAVIWEGEQATVWVEQRPQVFERRRIKAGVEQNGLFQVQDGLQPGERVVSRGAIFVQNESQQ
jgi:cobalt-zinc-cadmium efflux system membrane fusion protein